MASFEEKLTRKMDSKKNRCIELKIFQGCFKNKKQKIKKKKKNRKRLNFMTQFKIEFLLPFTGCRKVLEKMPGLGKKVD